jgi:hypothetical protein
VTSKEVAKLIKEIRYSLLNDYFSQVKTISRPGLKQKGHKLIGFILGSMMIDYLAGFYCGVTKTTLSGAGNRYKVFVNKYMPSYDSEHLWSYVRSRLVHNYSVDGNYGFTHMEQDGKHFEQVMHSDGKIYTVLNLEDFLKDIENAAKNYLEDLRIDTALQ